MRGDKITPEMLDLKIQKTWVREEEHRLSNFQHVTQNCSTHASLMFDAWVWKTNSRHLIKLLWIKLLYGPIWCLIQQLVLLALLLPLNQLVMTKLPCWKTIIVFKNVKQEVNAMDKEFKNYIIVYSLDAWMNTESTEVWVNKVLRSFSLRLQHFRFEFFMNAAWRKAQSSFHAKKLIKVLFLEGVQNTC